MNLEIDWGMCFREPIAYVACFSEDNSVMVLTYQEFQPNTDYREQLLDETIM